MKILRQLSLGFILSLGMGQVLALDTINTPWYSNTAIEGYDPVAYFSENAAVEGNKSHKLEWQGANWHFASAQNRALFEANPEKYAPQYGGYCAWAVANGDTASGDPLQWTVLNDRLYLNYDADIQAMWSADRESLIAKGDMNWPGVLN